MRLVRIDDDFEDWQGLLSLILDAFAFMQGRIDPASSALRLTPETLCSKAKAEIGFVVTDGGLLIGCVFCRPEPESLYIGKLAVSPAMQGRGVGALLLDTAVRIARERGLPALRLETRIELHENHDVFGRWGFEKTGEHAHPGFDRPTFVEMRRVL